jgi:ABC-type uncharacterized transport system permease subunit
VSLDHVTSNLALLAFALASVVYLLTFQRGARQETLGRIAFGLFVGATVSVSVALAAVVREATLPDMAGLLLTSAIGWLAVGGHVQFNLRQIGAFVAPLATLILLLKSFMAPGRIDAATAGSVSVLSQIHIGFAVLGQAFAIIACAVSVLYLWQQNLLKKKLLDQLPQNLPAIDRLSTVLVASLWSGFVFITLGLLTGALFTQMRGGLSDAGIAAKVAWAIAVWIWYLATLLAKNVFNRPSKRIAQMSLGGFLLMAMTYFGMGFFRPWGGV